MSRSQPNRKVPVLAGAAPTEVDPHHIDDLVVVRESDAGDNLLFEEMVYKTFGAHSGDLPMLHELGFTGVEPFLAPAKWNAMVERSRHSKTATFMHSGVLFMFHQGSAAGLERAKNSAGDEVELNAFTTRLIKLIERHTPNRVRVFNVNRLVRDRDSASSLASALRRTGTKVVTATNTFDLHADMDSMMWGVLSNFAAAERDGIVERNLLGRIAQARRGEWPNFVDHIPLGYRKEGRTIVPDLKMREKVATMLSLLADPNLSSSALCTRLGELGITRPRLREMYGEQATVADAMQPKDIRRGVLNWLDLYETGVHTVSLPAPNPKATQFGGRPVITYEGDPRAYVQLTFEFGVPDGGWAAPYVFAAIRHGHDVNGAFDVSNRRDRRPFTGRPPYPFGDMHLVVDANASRSYRLRKVKYRSLSKQSVSPLTTVDLTSYVLDEATTIATVRSVDLHRAVANGLVDAISSSFGVDGTFLGGNYIAPVTGDELTRRTLRLQIDEYTQQADTARRLALESKSASTSASFLVDAERIDGRLEAAKAELAELEAEDRVEPLVPLAVKPEAVIGALAALARCTSSVPPEVAAAIARLIPRFELFPVADRREIGWLAVARLPLADGRVIDLGPITGTVAVKSVVGHATGRRRSFDPSRHDDVVDRFGRGHDIDTIMAETGAIRVFVENALRTALVDGGFNEAAVLHLRRALVPDLRMFAMAAARHRLPARFAETRPDPDNIAEQLARFGILPAGWTAEWAFHVLDTYANAQPSALRKPWLGNCTKQHAIDAVASGTDTVMDALAALGHTYLDTRTLKGLIGAGGAPAVLLPVEPWVVHAAGGRADIGNRLATVPCPHCDGAATVHLVVPEIPATLLCPSCRRMPSGPSVEVPASYLAVPRGLDKVPPLAQQYGQKTRHLRPKADPKAVAADYAAGMDVLEILEKHDTDPGSLYRYIDEIGVPRRRPYRPRASRRQPHPSEKPATEE